MDWTEQQDFFIKAQPAPTSWKSDESWFHVLVIPETIITIHVCELTQTDDFIKRWWLNRPGPAPDINAALAHLIHSFVDEEVITFNRLRAEIERNAIGLKSGDETFTIECIENLMTEAHHMSTVFYEYQLMTQSVEFIKSDVLGKDNARHSLLSAQSIKTLREGTEALQHRLKELQDQHLMDEQNVTNSRLRFLTIISAVFMPLTLIAGIYGMNFEYMPELDENNAYFIVLGIMVLIAIGMLAYFKRKGWF
jgi:magnesium transporter